MAITQEIRKRCESILGYSIEIESARQEHDDDALALSTNRRPLLTPSRLSGRGTPTLGDGVDAQEKDRSTMKFFGSIVSDVW